VVSDTGAAGVDAAPAEPGAETGDPTASRETGDPTGEHEAGDPSAEHEAGDPSAEHEAGDPSAEQETGDPSAELETGDPTTEGHETGDPTTEGHETGDPTEEQEVAGSEVVEVVEEATVEAGPPCPVCGEILVAGANFCEACGAGTGGDGVPSATAPTGAAGVCDRCGGGIGADGYCSRCGHRPLEPVTVDGRDTMAFATHRGRRHHRNEDAGGLGTTAEGWRVLVVSDGVSASPNPDKASAAAVAAVTGCLVDRPFTGPDDLVEAVAAAHEAAVAVPAEGDPSWPADGSHPACTLVVAVVGDREVHVANVGDARLHVLTPAEGGGWTARQLSVDDSTAAVAVAAGVDPTAALAGPGGHAITAWLGADAPSPTPHLAVAEVAPGDLVLACSDGLWNYAPTDPEMAELVATVLPPGAEGDLGEAGEQLVTWANEQGGVDNITVALAPLPHETEETA
jgi:serine/threonine protein phosphatase PrpC